MSSLGRSARIYILAIDVAGIAAAIAAFRLWPGTIAPGPTLAAALLAALAAPFTVPLPVFGTLSIAFTFVFAALLLLGTPAAAVGAAASGITASLLRRGRRLPLQRLIFNAACLTLTAVAAGGAYHAAGGTPGPIVLPGAAPAILISTLTFFLLNTFLVAVVIGLADGLPLLRVWRANLLWTGPAYLAGAVLATALVIALERFGPWAVAFSVLPLYILYFSLHLYVDRIRQERRHGRQLADLYLSVIEALALAIDAKDRTTQRHLRRVQTFAVELGRALGLSAAEIEALKAGALLHDIGKLAVPEHILSKPGKLTRDEFEKMAIHPRIGAEILETVQFPFPLASVVRSHHEKFDGSGYPDRLKGEEIPMAARILSVVDCFDALTSDRPYRRPLTKEEALEFIRSEAGTSYDPRVVDALMKNLERMEGLAAEVNRTRERWSAPDKRKVGRPGERPARDTNALSASIMENISSAHRELYALYEIAQGLAKSLNLEEALTFIASKISRLLHYRCLALYLYDKDRKTLRARHVSGHDAARLRSLEIPLGERMSGWAAVHRRPIHGRAHGVPVRREGTRSDLEELLATRQIERLENAIAAPLLDGDTLLGVLALYDRPDCEYVDDDDRLISIVAKHVASAVKNATLYEATQESTLTDPLTSLPNARYLFVSFEEEIARATRQEAPLSLIELDVDDFKSVNDRHGHAAGDRILRGLARLIRAQLRGRDTCVRYAGDEFIITMPGIGKKEIGRLRDRLQKALEAHRFPLHGGRSLRLAVSMGAASFPEDGRTFEGLLAVADTRLQEEKLTRRPRAADGARVQRFSGRRDVPVN
jgi:diguanylate cyclase (GGDEF)-like protein/putative nucleotidyltransferase with HDIG domain